MVLDIPYGKSFYRVKADMRLLCAVEAEMGSLPALHHRFQNHRWHLTELVTLMQILLQAGGVTVDFMLLGDEILSRGFGGYLNLAGKCTGLEAGLS